MRAASTAEIKRQTTTVPAAPGKQAERLRYGILLAAALVTIGLIILYLVLGITWFSRPFLGVMVSHTQTVNAGQPTGSKGWAGLDAGMRRGDLIIQIDSRDVTDQASFEAAISLLKAEEFVNVVFERPAPDGQLSLPTMQEINRNSAYLTVCEEPDLERELASCRSSFALRSLPDNDFLAFFIIPSISALLVLSIGLLLVRVRGKQENAFMPILGCFLLAIFMSGMFDGSSTHALGPIWLVATVFLGGVLITLGLTFPLTAAFIYKYPLLRYVPMIGSVVLAAAVLVQYYTETPQTVGSSAITVSIAVIMSNATLATLLFFYQRPRARSPLLRDQSNTLFIGSSLALAPALVWLAGLLIRLVTGQTMLAFSIEATTPFFIPPAMSVGYAMLQSRPRDTDRVISQAISYTVMLGALIVGFFLLVLGANMLAVPNISANDPVLVALTIFFISMLFLPVRIRLQRRIDEIYFRTRRDYQNELEEFGRKLTSMVDYQTIIREFRTLLSDTVKPSGALVFLYNAQNGNFTAYGDPKPETDITFTMDSGVVQLLNNSNATIFLEPGQPWPVELRSDRARLSILKVMVIAGMSGSEQLNGFICLAPPLSGLRGYNYEELRFINNLVNQIAVTIERAQVIDNMERRVRQLDVLSRVGQAVNFTIEMDDLLELISAQTDQLISSPYFYIALHEPILNELFFAFFLEDDERNRDNEGQRWELGRDLFSEVVTTSQPLIVEDYAKAMMKNQYQFSYESRNIKAWMGVPLIAGTRTLGVLAVGESDANKTYNQDQLRIFSDISALAASAIEKARLFAETTTRARQLTILNDISRQMVAAEADIETLLSLITSAAVDILNAQAGSLLLTADDGSSDLEFKAAVGGTGKDLVGTRLKAGYGLVGKVAASGEPVISNDTSRDNRFDGDLNASFRTNSILAVPLIGKDRIVGVLEVLNKKDGTVYISEDVELLTTFAAQAAIALENARLFQMTDLQLSRRVQELENLELIDKELNRTLDLEKVAQITVRWAIANSGAVAGMLGVLTETKSHLRIVASYGYKEDLLRSNMVENGMWPIDKGIIKRVLRTRRADLAPDVKIDPDYTELLPRSISQITIPMLSGDELNSVLVLETNREPRFNLLDLDFVQRLAEHASIAIANAQLYEQLTRANESKSEFVGFAAHELKNPLTSVKGYADTLMGPMGSLISEQQRREFLAVIRSNADRMQTIIDDLRDIARIDADQPLVSTVLSPTSIRKVVVETLRPFQQQLIDKHQEVILNVNEDLPLVMGDETRLIQVMTNFVSNAYKYSPPEAKITINAKVKRVFRNERGADIGPVMIVSVKDAGIGMGEEDLQKIFKVRYFRSENQLARDQPGTGLGMMITQNIIEQHKGTVWVESEIGKGSIFYFTVPLAPEIMPEAQPQTEPASD